jgi:hypothetical protein
MTMASTRGGWSLDLAPRPADVYAGAALRWNTRQACKLAPGEGMAHHEAMMRRRAWRVVLCGLAAVVGMVAGAALFAAALDGLSRLCGVQ